MLLLTELVQSMYMETECHVKSMSGFKDFFQDNFWKGDGKRVLVHTWVQ